MTRTGERRQNAQKPWHGNRGCLHQSRITNHEPQFLIDTPAIRNALNPFAFNKNSISNRHTFRGYRPIFRRPALAALILLIAAAALPARFRQTNSEYQSRRAKLRATLDAPLILYGYTGKEDASEVALFFQEPYFYYLTGHSEPGAALLLLPDTAPGPHETLYIPPRNHEQEAWEGRRMAFDDSGLVEKTGFEAIRSSDNLRGDLENLAKIFPDFNTVMPPS